MKGFMRAIGLAAVAWVLAFGGPAVSQESLDQGKSPAQLFASDCAICHKTTAGLSKGRSGAFGGLKGFLREHYTASKEAAAAIASYVEATDKGPPPATKQKAAKGAPKGTPKGDEKVKKTDVKKEEKKADKKPDTEKTGEVKSDDKKPEEKKPEEKKPAETKTEKPAEAKPVEAKPAEAKATDTKSGDKPSEKKSD